jgi:starch synthase
MPLYLKQYYKDEPLFSKSKVVTSIYENEITGDLNSGIINKIKFDEVESDTLNVLENPTYENLYKLSIMNSDGVVFASENIKKSFLDVAMNSKIPVLKCGFKEGFEKEYMDFYNDKILN